MLPGFATDLLGLAFLLPITRPLARRVLAFFVARRINRLGGVAVRHRTGRSAASGPGTVIEGEATVDAAGRASSLTPGETAAQPGRDLAAR